VLLKKLMANYVATGQQAGCASASSTTASPE
jgi:hypothetical protein